MQNMEWSTKGFHDFENYSETLQIRPFHAHRVNEMANVKKGKKKEKIKEEENECHSTIFDVIKEV